ncbi:helix-turn-helix transcriptional regulator [Corynebacterium sp. p3-SID1056]|nr:helix-turn-helix transcriptional regulator [Corynebacterium sp. p3-SID1056]
MALYHLFTGSLEQAIPLFGETLSLFDDLDETAAKLIAGFQYAMALELSGAHNEALEVCAQAFTCADESGERWNRAHFHWVAGMAHFSLGQCESGREHARQGLEFAADLQDEIIASLIVELQSWIESAVGNHELASSLATAADDIWCAQGTSVQAFGPAMKARSVKAREPLVLEEQRVPRSKKDAIAFALSTYDTLPEADPTPKPQPEPGKDKDSTLTRREREVAELVGSGMTNRQVADKLVISTRTVEGHVENIFSKLQINNRSQIAVWLHG